MNASERVSLVEFHQQLLNYCIQGAGCTVQEKDFLSRLEKLIVQRDACLAQMIKKKESERMCSEDISDLEHQHAELVERMESIEKKCKLLALEQLSIDDEERPAKQLTRPDALQSAVANNSDQLNEK
uniref:Uncharacterized protein n=1 Tax=Anopheles minimus TaxID=112268 RepID=A0A182VQB4_9DIPT